MKVHYYSITIESINKEALRSIKFETKHGITATINHPKKIKRFTVLRSPHIDKKSRDQLEQQISKNSIIECYTPNKPNLTAETSNGQTTENNSPNHWNLLDQIITGTLPNLESLPIGVRTRLDLTEIKIHYGSNNHS